MRHQAEKVKVHPTALMTGADLGLDTRSMREIIDMVQEARPDMLVGGYSIDVIIIATAAVLVREEHMAVPPTGDEDWVDPDRDAVIDRIVQSLDILYAELTPRVDV